MQRRLTCAIALAVAALLCSCAGRARNVLAPEHYQPAAGATHVNMLVAATRSADHAAPGQMFTGDRGGWPSFADITVSVPPDSARQKGEIQWPRRLPGAAQTDFVTVDARMLTPQQAMAALDSRMRRRKVRRALVFVHGYNTTFEEAVYRFAQIVHDSGANAQPVLFTWPSAYGYDHDSSTYSRDALEKLLPGLGANPEVGEIAILAHSMGNWVVLEALRQMAIRNGVVNPKISSVMLAAPDVDFDVFRRQISQIGTRRPPFFIFTSQDDEALAMSRRVWGASRLGAINPYLEPYRSTLEAEGVIAFDLTNVASADRINHGRFARSPEVVQLIGRRLVAGQKLTDTSPSEALGRFAFGAASTIGAATGIVMAAPLAIVDPRLREGLDDQLGALGANLQAGHRRP